MKTFLQFKPLYVIVKFIKIYFLKEKQMNLCTKKKKIYKH